MTASPATPDTASKSEFAGLCGVNPSQVTRWIDRKLIDGAAIVGEGRLARIVVATARQQLAARRDPGQASGNGARTAITGEKPKQRTAPAPAERAEPSDPAFVQEKARLARAQADALELRNAVARGEQVSVEKVERHWSQLTAAIASRFLAVAGRVRRARPNLEADDVEAIDREIRDVLTDLAKFKPI